ncbi:hypothetical protein L596_009799 [Steinernema carpocapsae]|uniref:Uncharacterized protein n=1 Tax=Steinernema carpocapsae TaxID=34508 RepID=A0A4U5PHQ6_STECR|nr:hypothetical protein L596_009799 [Steinernema carpocapsae]
MLKDPFVFVHTSEDVLVQIRPEDLRLGSPQVFHASLDCAPRRLNTLGVDARVWIHEMLRVVHPHVAVSPPHAADTSIRGPSVIDDDTTIRYMLTYQVQEDV